MSDRKLENAIDDEPIAELACLKVQPQDNFQERFRDGVHRRALASQCLDFSFQAFSSYCFAMIALLLEAIDPEEETGQEDKNHE